MQLIHKIDELKQYLNSQREKGKTIGLVPTMGYLHDGHLSLIKKAREENTIVVVSIFVNPTQFGPNEDLDKYPRDLERDVKLVEEAGGDIVYNPTVDEIYPNGFQTYVEVEGLTTTLCGASRPGHFKGVTTVVTKLFHIVKPDNAYFGQKDAQQSIVIKRMVKDLNMDVNIVVCPIVREYDGLAMSSRNVYLSTDEREQSIVLFQSLSTAKQMIENGEKNAFVIKRHMTKMIEEMPKANIDYISIADVETLKEIEEIKKNTLIALAVKFGKTRLIDNVMVEV